MKKKNRKLKVYSKFQRRSGYNVNIPEIKLCGKWLKKAGFEINSNIRVKIISEGEIVIYIINSFSSRMK